MNGRKAALFSLDCSYWRGITLMLLPFLLIAIMLLLTELSTRSHAGEGSESSWALFFLASFALVLASAAISVVVTQHIAVGRALFYGRLREEPAGQAASGAAA